MPGDFELPPGYYHGHTLHMTSQAGASGPASVSVSFDDWATVPSPRPANLRRSRKFRPYASRQARRERRAWHRAQRKAVAIVRMIEQHGLDGNVDVEENFPDYRVQVDTVKLLRDLDKACADIRNLVSRR